MHRAYKLSVGHLMASVGVSPFRSAHFSIKGEVTDVAQEERLATSLFILIRLHLPYALVVRLHVHEVTVVILAPEAVGLMLRLSSSQSWSVGLSIPDEPVSVVVIV